MDSFTDTRDLLMDVDELGFLNDDEAHDNEEDLTVDIDPISNAPMVHFPGEQPLVGGLHFKLNNVMSRSLAYDSAKEDVKLYPVHFTNLDESLAYTQYVSKLFEIYQGLGGHRRNDVPTIGLIKQKSRVEHLSVLNLAFHAFVTELEFYIEAIKDTKRLQRISDLEECLTILNCLKTMYFITDSPDANHEDFIESMLNWVNRADGEPSEYVINEIFDETLLSRRKVYEAPEFWELVCQLLLRGLWSQSVQCFKDSGVLDHQNETVTIFITDLIALTENYPVGSETLFREWKSKVLELMHNWVEQDVDPTIKRNILNTLMVLSGSKDAILNASKYWYESFCGLMLYYIPTLELSKEYNELSVQKHSPDVCNNWENACYDIIRDHVINILPVLESLDLATAAFVAALCEAKGIFHTNFHDFLQYRTDDGIVQEPGVGDFLLSQLAFLLCSHSSKSLWPVAVGLISLAPNTEKSIKRAALSELLPHYPYTTNDDVEWLLTVCAKWRLPEVAKTIYKTLGQDALYQSNIVEAMTNFSKAGEHQWVKHYCWMIFEASVLQGKPLEDMTIEAIVSGEAESFNIPRDLIDSMVTDVMRQTLSPYAVLYEFHKLLGNNETEKAINHIIKLLSFPYMPQQYFIILLARFFYPFFLLNEEVRLEEEQVMTVLSALENHHEISVASESLYEQIQSTMKEEGEFEPLPEKIENFLRMFRKTLNYKLCQSFM